MYVDNFSTDDLEEIFENRFSLKEQEWKNLKSSFIDSGLDNLLEEDVNNITFQIVCQKIMNLSDEEVFEHLIDELD